MSKHLGTLLLLLLLLPCGPVLASPQWVTHTSIAGPDQPSSGWSRFDELFMDSDGKHRLPFPFTDLVSALEANIDNGTNRGVREVFIPLGRSLQRNASAPAFFDFPRRVIALQGEPVTTTGVLEYRLFIAHQPGTETLEVISYNDSAGRFEFQVVDAYNTRRQPRVRQANRLMCLSCHQNAAPIFALRPWRETNFNVEVATRLRAANPRQFQSFIDSLSADADAIDLLTDRANYLAVAQLIWQRGCSSTECRAAILRAVLQYRLSGGSGFIRAHPGYKRDYLAELGHNWRRNWPDGLALASSRIADRNPFPARPMTRAEDALTLRPPHATWRDVDEIVADGIIARLAGFFTQADIRQLDRHLIEAGSGSRQEFKRIATSCRLLSEAQSPRRLECVDNSHQESLQATIELDYGANGIASLRLLSLRLPGDAALMQPAVSRLSFTENGLRAELKNPDSEISMRMASGDRLHALSLHWQDDSPEQGFKLEIEIARDFERLEKALIDLLLEHRNGTARSLAAGTFRRARLLAELNQVMGLDLVPGDKADNVPAAMSPAYQGNPDRGSLAPGRVLHGDLELLQAVCGNCHGDDTQTPPGFLAGVDIQSRINQCAPRILARLRAWHDASADAIAPMPPPAAISADWAQGEIFYRLSAAVGELIEVQRNSDQAGWITATDYNQLPACLAQD